MKLNAIICEAKCCSAELGRKHAKALSVGEDTPNTFYDLLRINAYIRTLERNKVKHEVKKGVKPITSGSVSFDALEKKDSFLTLPNKEVVVCTKTEIRPCLSDDEICKIVEEIKLLCSTCQNCNCY
jgi:hypothetical protein